MTTKRKGYMTLAEHHAQLKAEGKWDEYVARRAQQEAERQKLHDAMENAEAPLVAALRSAGVEVQSVWDFVSRQASYSTAIPILFEHLRRDYPDEIREGILRALATPEALSHWDELVEIFEHNTLGLPPERRYVAAVALNGAADDSVIEDVLRLISDQTLGLDRLPLLLTLQRSTNSKAKMLLLELRDDPALGKEVKRLRRLERKQRSVR